MSTKIKNNVNINYSSHVKTIGNDDNSISNYYYLGCDIEYNKDCKRFLENFTGLKDYFFNKIMSFDSDYKLENDFDTFGKKIFDWFLGECSFPVKEYKEIFDIKDEATDLYSQRRIALIEYFSSNLSDCLKKYNSFLSVIDNLNCSEEYKNDILIDGRNIAIELNHFSNIIYSNNSFQNTIVNEEKIITTALYDRIKASIYEKVFDDIISRESITKNTIIYSNSTFEDSLNKVQDLILLTLYNGSITHLKLCRKVFFYLLYNYSKYYKNQCLYEYMLIVKALDLDYRNYKKINNYLLEHMDFKLNKNFIKTIFSFSNIINNYYRISFLAFYFDNYGYYLDNDEYNQLEIELLKYLCNKNDRIIFNIEMILKAFRYNKRIKNYDLLFKAFKLFIKNKFIRFYDDIGLILNSIDINRLNKGQYKQYLSIVKKLADDSNLDLNSVIVKILRNNKNARGFKKYYSRDRVKKDLQFYKDDNNYEFVEKVYNYLNNRYQEKESNPSVYRSSEYFITLTRQFLIEVRDEEKILSFIKEKIFNIIEKILLSLNQSNDLKIEALRILIALSSIQEYAFLEERIIEIVNNTKCSLEVIKEYINCPYEFKVDDINVEIAKKAIMINYGKVEDMMFFFENIYNKMIKSNILIFCLIIISYSCKNKSLIIDDIYKLHLIIINSDIFSKEEKLYLLKAFIDSKYEDYALDTLNTYSISCTYEEAKDIKELLEYFDKDKSKKVKENILKNNNYLIRNVFNDYDED